MNQDSFEYRNIDRDKLPNFGFKIHISATIENYEIIKNLLFPFLEERNIAFKFLKNFEEVLKNFSFQETIAEAGKYFTIYPTSTEVFIELLNDLYNLLPNDLEGIYIMSDRPFKDSKIIFYRFGTIRNDLSILEDGIPTLYGPNGESWQDYQRGYFELPSWIEDIQEQQEIESSYLSDNYTVFNIIKSNAGGNIYLGKNDINNVNVVIKESRANILYNHDLTKKHLRNHEFELMSLCEEYTPNVFEKVEEWINSYTIYESIDGISLYEYAKKLTLFDYRMNNDDDKGINLAKFKKCLNLIKDLVDLVLYFHQKGIIINDLHPDNIKITTDGKLYLIDMEHSYRNNIDKRLPIRSEISLPDWNDIDGKIADFHKLGNSLLYIFAKLHVIKGKNVKDSIFILNSLLESYGISSNIAEFIIYLFKEDCNGENVKIFSEGLIAKKCYKNYSLDYSLDYSLAEYEGAEKYSLIEFVKLSSPKKYYQVDEKDLFKILNNERKFGLNGLLGSLILHQHQLSREVIDYFIEKVLNQVTSTSSGKVLKIAEGFASPYIYDGSAGLVLFLLYFDRDKYSVNIVELMDGLKFEFAQRPSLLDGMLGLAYTFIVAYSVLKFPSYLHYAERLLLTISFYIPFQEDIALDYRRILALYKVTRESQNEYQ